MTFEKPDKDRFPCLGYAYEAIAKNDTMPAAMNAANDYMVEKFLNGQCKFADIPYVIRRVMDNHEIIKEPSLDNVKKVIKDAIRVAEKYFSEINE